MVRPIKKPPGRGRGRPHKVSKIESEEVDKAKVQEIENLEENAKKNKETEKNVGTIAVEEAENTKEIESAMETENIEETESAMETENTKKNESTEETENSNENLNTGIRIARIYNFSSNPVSNQRAAVFIRAIEGAEAKQHPPTNLRPAISDAIGNAHRAKASIRNRNVDNADVETGNRSGETENRSGETENGSVETGNRSFVTGNASVENGNIEFDFESSDDEYEMGGEETIILDDETAKADVQKDTNEDEENAVEPTEKNKESGGNSSNSDRSSNSSNSTTFWRSTSLNDSFFGSSWSNYFDHKENAPNPDPTSILRCIDDNDASDDDEDLIHIDFDSEDELFISPIPEKDADPDDDRKSVEENVPYKSGLFEDDSSSEDEMPLYVQQWY